MPASSTRSRKSLVAEVRRDGQTYIQRYRRGKPLGAGRAGRAVAGHGHDRHLHARPRDLPGAAATTPALIAERLEVKTYLNKGLVIQFVDQKNKTNVEFRHDGGVVDFLDAINRQRSDQRVAPLPFVLEREDEEDGLRCHLALAWTEATDEDVRSFVNTIPTRDGGTHELGMLAAVGTAVQRFMETHDLVKKGMEIKREDIREGLTAVLAVCVREPQFQGQTKGRLNNPEVKAQVESMTRPGARELPAQEQERGRRDRGPGDPGGQGPRGQPRRRLAGPAQDGDQRPAEPPRQAPRLRQHQPRASPSCSSSKATAPAARPSRAATATSRRSCRLKGKVLNAEQAGKAKVLDNKELTDIISALGCGMDDQYDPGAAPLRQGHPPDRRRQRRPPHRHAAPHVLLPARPRPVRRRPRLPGLPAALQDRLGQGDLLGVRRRRPRPDPGQAPQERQAQHHPVQGTGRDARRSLLFETTLDPARRRLLRVVIPDDDRPYTDRTVSDLMGKEPEARFKFIMEEAYTAKDIDI